MSLDVYLRLPHPQDDVIDRIFIREDGQTKEISREEWDTRFPDREPLVVAGDEDGWSYSANITHNLSKMAKEACIYEALWSPEDIGITHAKQLITPLRAGLALMRDDPDYYKQFDAANGWGLYIHFVPWIEKYLAAFEAYPEAEVSVSV